MIKNGVVKLGSPSAASGLPSDHIEEGEPLCEGEDMPLLPQDLNTEEEHDDGK